MLFVEKTKNSKYLYNTKYHPTSTGTPLVSTSYYIKSKTFRQLTSPKIKFE